MNLVPLAATKRRVGRGIAAGQGKTAGRGTKGQNARTGKKRYTGFMTGALPLAQRLPKKSGVKSTRPHYSLTNTQLAPYFKDGEAVTVAKLQRRGLIGRVTGRTVIKIVAGKTDVALNVTDERILQSRAEK